jgi:hypothetical protein
MTEFEVWLFGTVMLAFVLLVLIAGFTTHDHGS